MIVGITGGIASGKSVVSSYLKQKNYKVIDADSIGHNILADVSVKKILKKEFGKDIFDENTINRKKLGEIVFNNKEKLKLLNEIMHKRIKIAIREKLKEVKGLVFLEIALLYEANFTDLVDKIIVVNINKKLQIKRLMKRNNYTENEALNRINSQIPNEEKVKLADYVIDNSGSIENTYKQIDNILEKLKGKKECY